METIKNKLSNNVILEIVNRIVKAVDPEQIILFGSYAYGLPHKHSDLDILVVMKSDLPRHKRPIPIYAALFGLFIPKDIVVYTPEEIKAWENVPQAFITSIIRKGKIIYEKQPRPGQRVDK